MSQESSVVCLYPTVDAAEGAVRELGRGGFPIQHVSIITRDLGSEKKVHGFVTPCDVAKSAARTGAWVGGIFGLLAGAAFVWLPGVGPLIVAGSLTSALMGGLEGAAAGAALTGVLGWLGSLGISRQHILKYEESVKAGKTLVVAHGSVEEVRKAEAILAATSPAALNLHGQAAA
jgi:hypothetical protein